MRAAKYTATKQTTICLIIHKLDVLYGDVLYGDMYCEMYGDVLYGEICMVICMVMYCMV